MKTAVLLTYFIFITLQKNNEFKNKKIPRVIKLSLSATTFLEGKKLEFL